MEKAPLHVVLVHGTFARNAPWIDPERSGLCDTIRQEVGGNLVAFEPFNWSGANSHAQRKIAGLELSIRLAEINLANPDAKVFVVGHSHGGTVIAQAIKQRPELSEQLCGAVFLSTPFVQLQRRPFARRFLHAIGVATAIAFGLGICGFLFKLIVGLSSWWIQYATLATVAATMANWFVRRVVHKKGDFTWRQAIEESFATFTLIGALSFGGLGSYAAAVSFGFSSWVAALLGLLCGLGFLFSFTLVWGQFRRKFQRDRIAEYAEIISKRQSRMDSQINALIEEFVVPEMNNEKTIYVRTNADEAALSLTFVHAISRGISELLTLVFSVTILLDQLRNSEGPYSHSKEKKYAARIALGCVQLTALLCAFALTPLAFDDVTRLLSLGQGWLGFDLSAWKINGGGQITPLILRWAEPAAQVRGQLGPLLKVGAAIVLSSLLIAVGVLIFVNRAFGQWFLWSSIFLEISVEAVPPGVWRIVQLDAVDQSTDWDPEGDVVLAHSMSYEDPRAKLAVATWIAGRAGLERTC
jgi:pimeloyl-ACP methyl ester carboxylesterase